jgi:hypothetical protein
MRMASTRIALVKFAAISRPSPFLPRIPKFPKNPKNLKYPKCPWNPRNRRDLWLSAERKVAKTAKTTKYNLQLIGKNGIINPKE